MPYGSFTVKKQNLNSKLKFSGKPHDGLPAIGTAPPPFKVRTAVSKPVGKPPGPES